MGLDIAVLAFVGVVVLVMVLGCLINLFQKKCPREPGTRISSGDVCANS